MAISGLRLPSADWRDALAQQIRLARTTAIHMAYPHGMDLEAVSGFAWLPFARLELQLYAIRHVQQHVGELTERLGSRESISVDWIAARSG
jgi:hypothetical protein